MNDQVFQEAWRRFHLAKPRPTEGSGWLRGTGLVLMTSTGRLLSGTVKDRNGMAAALNEVLELYAKLPEEERRPKTVSGKHTFQEAPPPGGLVLTVYDRPLGRSETGQYRLPQGNDLGGFQTQAPAGQRSSLWLKEAEWRALVPSNPVQGKTQSIPPKLAKRIFLFALVPQTLWVVEDNWKPNSVQQGELKLTVEQGDSKTVRMRVHGSVVLSAPSVLRTWPDGKFIKNLEHRYDARLEGVIVYDPGVNRITRWDMAALGDYQGRWFAGNSGWKEATVDAPLALGFSFELDRTAYELPAERRRPRSFIHAYIFQNHEAYYWEPEKWEEAWKKQY